MLIFWLLCFEILSQQRRHQVPQCQRIFGSRCPLPFAQNHPLSSPQLWFLALDFVFCHGVIRGYRTVLVQAESFIQRSRTRLLVPTNAKAHRSLPLAHQRETTAVSSASYITTTAGLVRTNWDVMCAAWRATTSRRRTASADSIATSDGT